MLKATPTTASVKDTGIRALQSTRSHAGSASPISFCKGTSAYHHSILRERLPCSNLQVLATIEQLAMLRVDMLPRSHPACMGRSCQLPLISTVRC